jgi:hypothetical protein
LAPALGSMGSTVTRIMAAVTMAVAVGIIAVVGIITGTVTTGSVVTKGSVVEFAEVMISTAGTASMVEAAIAFTAEARSAVVVAASTVGAEQGMEADTGKRGFFA